MSLRCSECVYRGYPCPDHHFQPNELKRRRTVTEQREPVRFADGAWRWARATTQQAARWHLTSTGANTLCGQAVAVESQYPLGEFVPTDKCRACTHTAQVLLGLGE